MTVPVALSGDCPKDEQIIKMRSKKHPQAPVKRNLAGECTLCEFRVPSESDGEKEVAPAQVTASSGNKSENPGQMQ
jgi:hypothetical protein